MSIIYDLIFLVFAILYLPYLFLSGKYHKDIWQRFGIYPKGMLDSINDKRTTINDLKRPTVNNERPQTNDQRPTTNDLIWLHAVSVGEVAAIKPLWEALRAEFPLSRIVISTVTKTGNELAKKLAMDTEKVFYLPLDFSFVVKAALKKLRPSILIIAETELWPNLIHYSYKSNIPIALINGRISDKAFKKYRLVRFALRAILKKVNVFCVRSEQDRERFIRLGAPSGAVKTAGNLKFCDIKDREAFRNAAGIRGSMAIKEKDHVLMAGCTHRGEEEILLDCFRSLRGDFKDLHLILAPRHVERASQIKKLTGDLPVTIVNRIGVLKELYSVADIVFVGGSLIDHGGHNIIEPAVFSKPILFGPYMSNFKDVADDFLKAEAAICVTDKSRLEANCRRLLLSEDDRRALGGRARVVVLKNQGALEKNIAEIKEIIPNAQCS